MVTNLLGVMVGGQGMDVVRRKELGYVEGLVVAVNGIDKGFIALIETNNGELIHMVPERVIRGISGCNSG